MYLGNTPDSPIKYSAPGVCTRPLNQARERKGILAETGSTDHVASRSAWNMKWGWAGQSLFMCRIYTGDF